MPNDEKFTIHFEKKHHDSIGGLSQYSISTYSQHGLTQDELPKIITELTEKGYDLVDVERSS